MIDFIYKGKICEIGFVKEFKQVIKKGAVVKFIDDNTKKKLNNMNNEEIIFVVSRLNTIKIIESVEYHKHILEKAFEDKEGTSK